MPDGVLAKALHHLCFTVQRALKQPPVTSETKIISS